MAEGGASGVFYLLLFQNFLLSKLPQHCWKPAGKASETQEHVRREAVSFSGNGLPGLQEKTEVGWGEMGQDISSSGYDRQKQQMKKSSEAVAIRRNWIETMNLKSCTSLSTLSCTNPVWEGLPWQTGSSCPHCELAGEARPIKEKATVTSKGAEATL